MRALSAWRVPRHTSVSWLPNFRSASGIMPSSGHSLQQSGCSGRSSINLNGFAGILKNLFRYSWGFQNIGRFIVNCSGAFPRNANRWVAEKREFQNSVRQKKRGAVDLGIGRVSKKNDSPVKNV